jgi:hypothetical protein
MADEHISSQSPAPGAFAVEHLIALDILKERGSAEANNPEDERILADLAAAGFARRVGNAYVCTSSSPDEGVNPAREVSGLTPKQEKIIWAGVACLPQFRWVERCFWTVFLLLPFFTGLLGYDWLPNESYNPKRHLLLASEDVDDGYGPPRERPLRWQDKRTNQVYTRHDFAEHRWAEAQRIAATSFFYGLLGCAFFAWVHSVREKRSFYELFGKAMLFNLAIAAFFGLTIAF